MLCRKLTAVVLLLNACAAPPTVAEPQAGPPGAQVRVGDMPSRNVEVLPASLVAWGMTEVPAGSRLQAAKAMVDAITRAELLKFVKVGVGSMQTDVESTSRREIELITVEVVQARLPGATVVQHGWEQDGDVLRLVGRLEVTRDLLQKTFAESLSPAVAAAVVDHLFGVQP